MLQHILWNVGFLAITYIPLQVYALVRCRGVRRLLATLPVIPMAWLIAGAATPKNYEDGSLFGMYYFVIYWPTMLWLAAVCVQPRRQIACPSCGHQQRAKSFQLVRPVKNCDQCGESLEPKAS